MTFLSGWNPVDDLSRGVSSVFRVCVEQLMCPKPCPFSFIPSFTSTFYPYTTCHICRFRGFLVQTTHFTRESKMNILRSRLTATTLPTWSGSRHTTTSRSVRSWSLRSQAAYKPSLTRRCQSGRFLRYVSISRVLRTPLRGRARRIEYLKVAKEVLIRTLTWKKKKNLETQKKEKKKTRAEVGRAKLKRGPRMEKQWSRDSRFD